MKKMTAGQWLENYWYHYKWHTVIGLFLVLTLAVGITQCALRTQYDQNCVLYCNRTVSDNASLALQQELTALIPDSDGNGQALFEVYNVSYDADNTSPQSADFSNAQKIMVLCSTADYVLYAVDEYGYNRLMVEDTMQLFETYDFLPDKEGTAWNWKGSALQEKLKDYRLPDNLYFCIRKVAGTAAADDENAHEKARQAAALIQTLMAQ